MCLDQQYSFARGNALAAACASGHWPGLGPIDSGHGGLGRAMAGPVDATGDGSPSRATGNAAIDFLALGVLGGAAMATQPEHCAPDSQIHGSADRTFPIRYTHPDQIVTGGGHLLTLTHPIEVNEFLARSAQPRMSEYSVF